MIPSKVHSYIPAKNVRNFKGFDVSKYQDRRDAIEAMDADLSKIGISLGGIKARERVGKMADALMPSMDAIQPTVTTASVPIPIQFLQQWLPGFTLVITAKRQIDDFIGIMTVGQWRDEEIVQSLLELTGKAVPYGDYTNVPFSSWNLNYERITNVRFEEGIRVGVLESERAGAVNIDSANEKRQAASLSLEIARNNVGFSGYNNGANRTYGFLNAPGLPSYVTVATGASSSTLWASKTFLEIQKDILSAIASLRIQSQEQISPDNVDMVLAIATNARDYLAKTSDFGISVMDWLKSTYPRIRVTSAPQLNSANGGANVFYLYAERMDSSDMSTDGGAIFIQCVPQKFRVVGVQQLAKAYEEDYSNATAGVMCKRPFGVVRRSGI
jgi:hypothetical protein